jgi:hypothetical protein
MRMVEIFRRGCLQKSASQEAAGIATRERPLICRFPKSHVNCPSLRLAEPVTNPHCPNHCQRRERPPQMAATCMKNQTGEVTERAAQPGSPTNPIDLQATAPQHHHPTNIFGHVGQRFVSRGRFCLEVPSVQATPARRPGWPVGSFRPVFVRRG